MRQATIITSGFVTGLLLAGGVIWYQGQPEAPPEHSVPAQSVAQQSPNPLSSFSPASPVAVDSSGTPADELLDLLREANERPAGENMSPTPFVLHGREIQYFTRQQFEAYRELVELAGQLDADQVVEIKACRTTMQMLGIQESDLPAFIELVPFGPDEVERLGGAGYDIYTTF